ncbi:IclR family transcriptional regulator [uncultured Sneathiella sp.]|uniref:IclR family transcriptional regulator n=1 Tax=uncultured Sneathiella sp. TaxID=879315 RepID=UPI002592634F|nr:IclR family transcriptional regulator [uncultured Sneathiella sp.]
MATDGQNRKPEKPASRGGPQSVGRIFSILESLASMDTGATLSQLAISASAPKTSLVGLLAGLTEEGCVSRDENGRYYLGPRFITLAMRAVSGREFLKLARPTLVDLARETGETAVIAALNHEGDMVTYLDKVESTNSIRYSVPIGENRELYCTVGGKLLLAFFESERLETYLRSHKRKRYTETTLTGKSEIKAALEKIRQEGIARTSDEQVHGSSGLAGPIYSNTGEVIAAILIAGPSERMRANAAQNEKLVIRAAKECTVATGGVPIDSTLPT